MKLDFNKTYYKVTNKEENHRGLQYKTGLIEDILPFNNNKEETCTSGRIYITNLKHLPVFFLLWILDKTFNNSSRRFIYRRI